LRPCCCRRVRTCTDTRAKTQKITTKKNATHRLAKLTELAQNTFCEVEMKNTDMDSLLRFIIGVTLSLTLAGIVGVVLYSLVFVTQPMNNMAPIDAKFFELITPIATFITGSLGTLLAMNKKQPDEQKPQEPTKEPE
jgi:hypothetical protein